MNGSWKYLHTIDGKPAVYRSDEQLVFLADGMELTFAATLNQIRREERATLAWRVKHGLARNNFEYSYIRVRA